MKKFLLSLAVVAALACAETAFAGVFVHAGPVSVAVGGRVHRPLARPVVGVPHPAPVVGGWVGGRSVSPFERHEIREEARELRYDIRDAGAVVGPRERREIRADVRDLGREIRQAWRD